MSPKISKKLVGRTPKALRGRTLRGGVLGTFWKPPSQNPSESPSPNPSQNLLRTLLKPLCCRTTPKLGVLEGGCLGRGLFVFTLKTTRTAETTETTRCRFENKRLSNTINSSISRNHENHENHEVDFFRTTPDQNNPLSVLQKSAKIARCLPLSFSPLTLGGFCLQKG